MIKSIVIGAALLAGLARPVMAQSAEDPTVQAVKDITSQLTMGLIRAEADRVACHSRLAAVTQQLSKMQADSRDAKQPAPKAEGGK